jgi:hypothetical protein
VFALHWPLALVRRRACSLLAAHFEKDKNPVSADIFVGRSSAIECTNHPPPQKKGSKIIYSHSMSLTQNISLLCAMQHLIGSNYAPTCNSLQICTS